MLFDLPQRFGAVLSCDLCLKDSIERDKTSSRLRKDYELFVFSASSAVVEAYSTVISKNGRGVSQTGRAPNREFGRNIAEEICCRKFFSAR